MDWVISILLLALVGSLFFIFLPHNKSDERAKSANPPESVSVNRL